MNKQCKVHLYHRILSSKEDRINDTGNTSSGSLGHTQKMKEKNQVSRHARPTQLTKRKHAHLFVHMYVRAVTQRRPLLYLEPMSSGYSIDKYSPCACSVPGSVLEGKGADRMKESVLSVWKTQGVSQTTTVCGRLLGGRSQSEKHCLRIKPVSYFTFGKNQWKHRRHVHKGQAMCTKSHSSPAHDNLAGDGTRGFVHAREAL